MKAYIVTLKGTQKTFQISEEQAETLIPMFERKESHRISLNGNHFDTADIKFINPTDVLDISNANKKFKEIDTEWRRYLFQRQKLPVLERSKKEWSIRIFPGIELSKANIDRRHEIIVKNFILDFFTQHPEWPYCNMQVWWPWTAWILKKQGKKPSRWFVYVSRHDGQVKEYMKLFDTTPTI